MKKFHIFTSMLFFVAKTMKLRALLTNHKMITSNKAPLMLEYIIIVNSDLTCQKASTSSNCRGSNLLLMRVTFSSYYSGNPSRTTLRCSCAETGSTIAKRASAIALTWKRNYETGQFSREVLWSLFAIAVLWLEYGNENNWGCCPTDPMNFCIRHEWALRSSDNCNHVGVNDPVVPRLGMLLRLS